MKSKVFALMAIIIVVGMIMAAVLGFRVDSSYSAYQLVDVEIGKDFNRDDVKNIAKEIWGNANIEVQKSGVYSDNAIIKVPEISQEQKETLNSKINEKYGIENTVDSMDVNYIPNYKLRDVIRPYIIPLAITTVIILVYVAIKYWRVGISKVIYQTVVFSIMAELVYGAIIAITRFPVNRLVMPVGVIIYVGTICTLVATYEKQVITKKQNVEEH